MPPEPALTALLGFLFGVQFGSFITLASHRIPMGEDIVFTPSRCPRCRRRLRLFDLFPILSWIASRGKCRYCKSPVSVRYPLIEAATGVLAAILVTLHPPFSVEFLLRAGGGIVLMTALVMLLEGRRVPPLYYAPYHAATAWLLYASLSWPFAASYAAVAALCAAVLPRLGNRLPGLRLYAGMAAVLPLLWMAPESRLYGSVIAASLAAIALPFRSALRPAEIAATTFLLIRMLLP